MHLKELEKEIEELEILLAKQNNSKFSCVQCFNQHKQIYNWLVELKSYENGEKGKNQDDPSQDGYLTLDEAIYHTKEVIKSSNNIQEKTEHKKLLSYLEKLKEYR